MKHHSYSALSGAAANWHSSTTGLGATPTLVSTGNSGLVDQITALPPNKNHYAVDRTASSTSPTSPTLPALKQAVPESQNYALILTGCNVVGLLSRRRSNHLNA